MVRPKRQGLTPVQKDYARFTCLPRSERGTQKDFCERVGVSRETLRNWRAKPEFIAYKKRLYSDYIESKYYLDVIDSLAELAKCTGPGSAQAAKILLEHKETLDRYDIERAAVATGGTQINVIIPKNRPVWEGDDGGENDDD